MNDINKFSVSVVMPNLNGEKLLEKNLPKGYVRVSAVLPEHQAYIVKKWAEDALKKREPKT